MPESPNDRAWHTSTQIATRIARDIGTDDRLPQDIKDRIFNNKDAFIEVVRDALANSGLAYEFTLLRLVEKVKDSIFQLAFGPLGLVDDRTPLGEVADILKDCYTPEFLELFDEEGNSL